MGFNSTRVPTRERERAMRTKRILWIALLLFALYFIAVYPSEAAELARDTVGGAIDLAEDVAQSLSDFVRELVV